MARLERFKYLPMLYRAYQEARDRAKSQSQNPEKPGHGDDRASLPGQTTGLASESLSRGNGKQNRQPVTRMGGQRPTAKRIRPARTSTLKQTAAGASKSSKQAQRASTQGRGSARALRGTTSPSLRNVLNELRVTKQQLSQLRAIQAQLTEVQLKLDEQLQVLRNTMDKKDEKKQDSTTQTTQTDQVVHGHNMPTQPAPVERL